eukprot:SM000208S06315  [mRNA]  locus=s208:10833:12004:- [translate_table: standard]
MRDGPLPVWQPTVDPDGEEFLTYRLVQPLCVVVGVEILPAPLRRCHAPRRLQVDVGFDEAAFEQSSEEFAVENQPVPQFFALPRWRLMAGGYVRLRMRGMHGPMAEPHPATGGDAFCVCIHRVRVVGLALGNVRDNLLAEALVAHAWQRPGFRAAVRRGLRPAVGEELHVEEIVAGFRTSQLSRPAYLDAQEANDEDVGSGCGFHEGACRCGSGGGGGGISISGWAPHRSRYSPSPRSRLRRWA